MYNYVLYYNIEKSGFNAVSAYFVIDFLVVKMVSVLLKTYSQSNRLNNLT